MCGWSMRIIFCNALLLTDKMTDAKLKKGDYLLSWQNEDILHCDRILFCMRPKNHVGGWTGKYLMTFKTKKSLKLYRNYTKNPDHKYRVTELIPLEIKQGHKPERVRCVNQLIEQGYDGWYGTLHGNLSIMEYCIFNPQRDLEVTDILQLESFKRDDESDETMKQLRKLLTGTNL